MKIGPIGISSATLSYLFAGGVEMLKSYLQYRREKRIAAEERAQVREKEAYEKGRQKGKEEERASQDHRQRSS